MFIEEKYEVSKLDTGERLYHINNSKYPSVTTICNILPKTYLLKWKKKNKEHFEDVKNYAATLGTIGHWRIAKELAKEWDIPYPDLELNEENVKIIEQFYDNFPYDKGNKYQGLEEDISRILMSYDDWYNEYEPELPIIIRNGENIEINPLEKVSYSHEYCYAGTVDILCSIKKNKNKRENYIVDTKTNDHIATQYMYQTSAYKINIEEMYPGTKIDKLCILNVSPEMIQYQFRNINPVPYKWLSILAQFYNQINIPELNQSKKKSLENINKKIKI